MSSSFWAEDSVSDSLPTSTRTIASLPLATLALGTLLWLLCTLTYFASGTVYISSPDPRNETESPNPGVQDQFLGLDTFSVNDSSAVISQALSIVHDGDLTFHPLEVHHMFDWHLSGLEQAGVVSLPAIDDRLRDWIRAGTLRPARNYPQVVKTTTADVYTNCFGIGGALTAAPAFWLGERIFGRLDRQPDVLDRLAFTVGSLLVSGSVLLLFWTWRRQSSAGTSLVLALTYAFGTSVYSTSSQGMWQHSATALFVSAGLWILARPAYRPWHGYALGVLFALATLSRPTMAMIAVAGGLHLLWVDRKSFLRYALAGLPFALLLLGLNNTFFGSPLRFGQTVLVDHAFEKTGVAQIWQTPVTTGLAGLLVSPSRGLFVYSPVLLFLIPGMVLAWRRVEWRWLRSLSLGVAAIILMESRHFDWWGGWSYGYRHLVDLSPIFVSLMLPVMEWVGRDVRLRLLYAGTLAASIGIQVIGVTANDLWRWNARTSFVLQDAEGRSVKETTSFREYEAWLSQPGNKGEVATRNIDRVAYRSRLWSWSDQPVRYYLSRFRSSWLSRQSQLWNARQPYRRKLAESYRNIAVVYAKANLMAQASLAIDWSLQADPSFQEGLLSAWEIRAKATGRVDGLVSHLQRACAIHPKDRAAWIYLGFVHAERGSLPDAVAALEEVLRQDLEDFRRRYEMGREMMDHRVVSQTLARPAGLVRRDLRELDAMVDLQVKAREAELDHRWSDALEAYDQLTRLLPVEMLAPHEARIFERMKERARASALLRGEPLDELPRAENVPPGAGS